MRLLPYSLFLVIIHNFFINSILPITKNDYICHTVQTELGKTNLLTTKH